MAKMNGVVRNIAASVGTSAPDDEVLETYAPARRRAKAKAVTIATVAVLNPLTNGALRAATAMGAALDVVYQNGTLVVRARLTEV